MLLLGNMDWDSNIIGWIRSILGMAIGWVGVPVCLIAGSAIAVSSSLLGIIITSCALLCFLVACWLLEWP